MAASERVFDALRAGDADALARLLATDAHLAHARTGERGLSALMFALYHRRPDLAGQLREAGAQPTPFEAAALGDRALVGAALDGGAVSLSERAADGFSLLHLACFFGHPELAADLLQRGAEVNLEAASGSGLRPLHSAVASRSRLIATQLLAAGADPDAQQRGGFTALQAAALHGDEALTRTLLAGGADREIAADDGRTAGAMARDAGHEALIGLLTPPG